MSDTVDSQRYQDWKSWNEEQFAVLGPVSERYFAAELRAAGVPLDSVRKVLEIGFGNGEFLRFALDRKWEIVGTEINHELIARAQRLGVRAMDPAGFEAGSDGGFDLVVLFDVLEHLNHDALRSLLSSLAHRLQPGGAILCRFPNADSPLGRPFQHGDVTHVTAIGEFKLTYLARVSGLKVRRFSGQQRVVAQWTLDTLLSYVSIRAMEFFVERSIKHFFFKGWRFAIFSPNSVAVLTHAD